MHMSSPTQPPRFTYGLPSSPENTPIKSEVNEGSLSGRNVQRCLVALPIDVATRVAKIGSNPVIGSVSSFGVSLTGFIAAGSIEVALKVLRIGAENLTGIVHTADEATQGILNNAVSVEKTGTGVMGWVLPGFITNVANKGVDVADTTAKSYSKFLYGIVAALAPTVGSWVSNGLYGLESYSGKVRKISCDGLLNPSRSLQNLENIATRLESFSYYLHKNESRQLIYDDQKKIEGTPLLKRKNIPLDDSYLQKAYELGTQLDTHTLYSKLYQVLSSSLIIHETGKTYRLQFSFQDIKRFIALIDKLESHKSLSKLEKRDLAQLLWLSERIESQKNPSTLFQFQDYSVLDFSQKVRLFHIVNAYAPNLSREEAQLMARASSMVNSQQWMTQFSSEERKLIECSSITHFNKLHSSFQRKLSLISRQQIDLLPPESREVIFSIVRGIVESSSNNEEAQDVFSSLLEKYNNNVSLLISDPEGIREFVKFIQEYISEKGALIIQESLKQTLRVYDLSSEDIKRAIFDGLKSLKEEETRLQKFTSLKESNNENILEEIKEIQKNIEDLTTYINALKEARKTLLETQKDISSLQQNSRKIEEIAKDAEDLLKQQAQTENMSLEIEDLHQLISSSVVSEGRFHTMGSALGVIPKAFFQLSGTALATPMYLLGYVSSPTYLSLANRLAMFGFNMVATSQATLEGVNTYLQTKTGYGLTALEKGTAELTRYFIKTAPSLIDRITTYLDYGTKAIEQSEIQDQLTETLKEAQNASNLFSKGLQTICQNKSGLNEICTQQELSKSFPDMFSQLQEQTSKLSDPTAKSILQNITKISLEQAQSAADNVNNAISMVDLGNQVETLFETAPELQKNFTEIMKATQQFAKLQSQMTTKVEAARLLEESQGIISNLFNAVPYAKDALSKTKEMMQNLSSCLKVQAGIMNTAATVTSAQISAGMTPHIIREKLNEAAESIEGDTYVKKGLKYTFSYALPFISTAYIAATGGFVVAPILVKHFIGPALNASGDWIANNTRKMWYSLAAGTEGSGKFLGERSQALLQSLGTYIQSCRNHGIFIDPQRRDNFLSLSDFPGKKHLQRHVFEVVARSHALESPLLAKLDTILEPRKQLFSTYLSDCTENEKILIQRSFDTFFSSIYRSCTHYIDETIVAESIDTAWNTLLTDLEEHKNPRITDKCSAMWKKIRQNVLEAYSTSTKGELTAHWKQFQDGIITLEKQGTLIDSILLLYDTLRPDERLMLTPEMFQKLGVEVQRRVREAVRKYSPESLSTKISNDITYIVEQFNMLSESQRKSINTMTLREFHALSIYEQKELLFSLFHSTAFKEMIEKELDRGTPLSAKELFDCYQGAIKIEDGLIVSKKGAKLRLTNKEIKKLLSLIPQVSQEEQDLLTPGKLRAMGDRKMEHAYEIVQKYYSDMIPKGLLHKLPVRKGHAIEERHRVRYSEAITSIFRQLKPHQQAELLLMSQGELEEMSPEEQIQYARVLLEKLEKAHDNTSLIAKVFAGKEAEYTQAITVLQKAITEGATKNSNQDSLLRIMREIFNSALLTSQDRAEIRSDITIAAKEKKDSLQGLFQELHSLEKNVIKETRKKLRIEDQIEYIEGDIATLQDKNRLKNSSPQSESLVTLKADLERKKTELDICEKEIETCTEKYSHLRSTIEEMTGSLIDDPSSLDIAAALQEVAKRHIRNTLFQALSFPHIEQNKIFTQKLHSCTSTAELTTISHEISDYIQKNRVSLNQKLSEVHEEMKTLKETIGSKENFQEKANRLRYLQNKVVPMIEIMKEIIDDLEVGTQSLISNTEKRIAILPPPPPKTFWRTLQQKAQAFAHSVQQIASSIFQGIKTGWSKLTSLLTRRSTKVVAPLKDTRPKKTIEKEKKHDFIQMQVEEFLHPYLSGKITPSTEDTKRKPLIESLYSQFRKQFPKATETKREIEILALESYILESAKGFNRNQSSIMDPDDKNNELILRHYIATLQHSLPIDFTNLHMPASEIELRAKNALRKLWTEANK